MKSRSAFARRCRVDLAAFRMYNRRLVGFGPVWTGRSCLSKEDKQVQGGHGQMSRKLVLSAKKELAAFRYLSPPLVQFLEKHGVPSAAAYATRLIVEELVSNVAKYSNQEEFSDAIDVQVTLEEDCLRVRIEYQGPFFDPCSAPPPDLSVPLAQRQLGGLGLYLVRNLAEDLSYERLGDLNRVEARIALS